MWEKGNTWKLVLTKWVSKRQSMQHVWAALQYEEASSYHISVKCIFVISLFRCPFVGYLEPSPRSPPLQALASNESDEQLWKVSLLHFRKIGSIRNIGPRRLFTTWSYSKTKFRLFFHIAWHILPPLCLLVPPATVYCQHIQHIRFLQFVVNLKCCYLLHVHLGNCFFWKLKLVLVKKCEIPCCFVDCTSNLPQYI